METNFGLFPPIVRLSRFGGKLSTLRGQVADKKCYNDLDKNWWWRHPSKPVPCLLLILFLAFPRLALVLMFFFSNYLEHAYHGLLLPILGFIFLPLTTLAYAWMINNQEPIVGLNLLLLILAVIIDVGGLGGGEYHRRSRCSHRIVD